MQVENMSEPQPTVSFSFFLKTDLRFGVGEVLRLPDHLRAFGWQQLALVTDAGAARNPIWQRVEATLRREFEVVAELETAVTEPTYDDLEASRSRFMNKPIDAFIALGGGSVLDMAKALSLLVTNAAPAIEYRGFDRPQNPGPPLVAIPTTAGTGSEVTPNAVFTDLREQRKFGINTRLYVPELCILDPQLTASCPRAVTISSGMDALVHSHESFVSRRATPISRLFASEAFRRVFNALGKAVERPDDMEARSNLQLGSYLAGVALFNSSAGPVGALSYPLGVDFKVPHGMAGAIFLPWLVQHNTDNGYTGYSELYRLIAGAQQNLEPAAASRQFSEEMWRLCERLQIPHSLQGFGFTKAHLDNFHERAKGFTAAFDMNPVPFTGDDVRRILQALTED